MGGEESKGTVPVPRRPSASSGSFGRGRMAEQPGYEIIFVTQVTPPVLGREVIKRCGEEGSERRQQLNNAEKTTLRFLTAAIDFIPMAMDDGADMKNVAFIFAQPDKQYLIKAGKGDWEFYFAQDANTGNVYGRCVRSTLAHYIWDKITSVFRRIGAAIAEKMLSILGPRLMAITG